MAWSSQEKIQGKLKETSEMAVIQFPATECDIFFTLGNEIQAK